MKYLYHCDDVNVEDVIDGTLYVIQPNKIVEVKDDFHAQALLNHKIHQGLIEVTVTPSDNGFDWTPGFKQMAADALAAADDARIQDWVTGQIEERVRKNYPPLPPSDRLKTIIKRRGVVIENFGLRPVEIKQGQSPVASPADSINVTELIQQRNTLDARLKQEQAERDSDRKLLQQLAQQVADLQKTKEATDAESDVDQGTDGEGTGNGANTAGGMAGEGQEQPDGQQSESGKSAVGGDGDGGGATKLQDITSRTVRRPNERKPTTTNNK